MPVGECQVALGGNPVAWCLPLAHQEESIEAFLEAQRNLTSLPETRAAEQAYRSAEEATTVVNVTLSV